MEMSDHSIGVPWGGEAIQLDLPANWSVRGILQPSSLPPVDSVGEEVLRALRQPIGMAGLESLVRPGFRVAIVIDDSSRPTPVKDILPFLLSQLELAGVGRSQLTVVPALGVHRPMEEAEIASRIGGDLGGIG
jgi:nickel-dependent lactate racemase